MTDEFPHTSHDHVPPEPFSTVPCGCEECTTRAMAIAYGNPYHLGGTVGVHRDDMCGFVEGAVSLTWHARERIRAALNEKAPACEVSAYEIPATTRYPEGPRVGFSGYLQSDPPACPTCEEIMVRRAAEYVCLECGQRTGRGE